MEEIKKYISEKIKNSLKECFELDINEQDIIASLEKPKNEEMGDIAYPCFRLSKVVKDSPMNIASKVIENIDIDTSVISNITTVAGYINIKINTKTLASKVITNVLDKKDNYGDLSIGVGKTITIDYSSPNIAKPFHIGHFRNTMIGRTLYNIHKSLGYNVIGINYLGDWGRQFGLLMEGYRLFKDEYNIEQAPIATLSAIYVKINKLAKEDDKVMDKARDNFKKLEEGDKEALKLWQYFKDVSLVEYERLYKILGVKFDSYNGEAYYNDKMDEVIDILNDKKVLKDSEGAKVVYVGEDVPPCIVLKSNGSTIYATRDLAAIVDRSRSFDYYKSIYVTGAEQKLHFKQVFKVAENLVEEKYYKNLIHVPYGLVMLKTGKMSSRDGTLVYLQDLINEGISKAKSIILEKSDKEHLKEIDIDNLAKQIGVGALIFNDLKHNKTKDVIFDLDECLRFDGETGPYIQYTYARICSLISKSGLNINEIKLNDVNNYEYNEYEDKLIKLIDKFENVIKECADTYEPAVIARYLIDLASAYSSFYNNNNVICDDIKIKEFRTIISYMCSLVIKKGLNILGIEAPTKM